MRSREDFVLVIFDDYFPWLVSVVLNFFFYLFASSAGERTVVSPEGSCTAGGADSGTCSFIINKTALLQCRTFRIDAVYFLKLSVTLNWEYRF